MSSLYRIGQALRGGVGKYIVAKQLQETVWVAKNQVEETVVIKAVRGHPRVENERGFLTGFRGRSPYIRPLVDTVIGPPSPVTIVLKYLDDNLLNASAKKTLNRKELKYVSRRILEALKVLHDDGYVHTDVKPDNILVDYRDNKDMRFANVQLGGFGGVTHVDSKRAKAGTPVGALIWTSPEVIMETRWNTATDIWAFGIVLINLIYGGNFHLFRPNTVPYGHVEYGLEILKEQFRYFGPFPPKYEEIASSETVNAILYLMQEIPKSAMTPFRLTTEREV